MRTANVDGCVRLLVAGGTLDEASASGGRFEPGAQGAYERFDGLYGWSAIIDQPAEAFSPEAAGPTSAAHHQVFAGALNNLDPAGRVRLERTGGSGGVSQIHEFLLWPSYRGDLPVGSTARQLEVVAGDGRSARAVWREEAWDYVADLPNADGVQLKGLLRVTLHQLRSITMGVPDPEPLAAYHTEFGLQGHDGWAVSTVDLGGQLFMWNARTRRLLGLVVGVKDHDDLAQARGAPSGSGYQLDADHRSVSVVEPESRVNVVLEFALRLKQAPTPAVGYNARGRTEDSGRSPAVMRVARVRPRRLGPAGTTTTKFSATSRFFAHLIGFKASEYMGDVGLSSALSNRPPQPVGPGRPDHLLARHCVGRQGLSTRLAGARRPCSRLISDAMSGGLGRLNAGSAFFWYLRDPAANYSEYYADLDEIPGGCVLGSGIPGWAPGPLQLGTYPRPPRSSTPTTWRRSLPAVRLGRQLAHQQHHDIALINPLICSKGPSTC